MHSLRRKMAVVLGCFTVAAVFLAPPLIQGDEWNRATRFSINQPFQVPNLVLEANTPYVIRLYDSPSERHVVQIYNEDQTQMLTMFMAISAERFEPEDETTFIFTETGPNYPIPIKEWFYPGRLIGLEFIYPKDQAAEIASHGRDRVLTTDVAELREPVAVEPVAESPGEVTKTDETAVIAEAEIPVPDPEPVEIAQNIPEPVVEEPVLEQQTPAAAVTDDSQELPRTAGELPLIGLIGLLCLGAGLGVKAVARQK